MLKEAGELVRSTGMKNNMQRKRVDKLVASCVFGTGEEYIKDDSGFWTPDLLEASHYDSEEEVPAWIKTLSFGKDIVMKKVRITTVVEVIG